jgi:hypothetical protein
MPRIRPASSRPGLRDCLALLRAGSQLRAAQRPGHVHLGEAGVAADLPQLPCNLRLREARFLAGLPEPPQELPVPVRLRSGHTPGGWWGFALADISCSRMDWCFVGANVAGRLAGHWVRCSEFAAPVLSGRGQSPLLDGSNLRPRALRTCGDVRATWCGSARPARQRSRQQHRPCPVRGACCRARTTPDVRM